MKEYTVIASLSVFITLFLDKFLGTGILRKREFYLFLFIIFLFKLLVNGYLTGENIVLYNPDFFSGRRVGSIPLEDFLFGFSMVTQTIIFWENFLKKQ